MASKIDQKRVPVWVCVYVYVCACVCARVCVCVGGASNGYVLTRTYGRLVTARSSKAYTVEI